METAIKKFRDLHGLTFDAIARAAGFPGKSTVYKHAMGSGGISPESALRYHRALGIPLSELRPDLWPPEEEKAPSAPAGANNEA